VAPEASRIIVSTHPGSHWIICIRDIPRSIISSISETLLHPRQHRKSVELDEESVT
jgi:hypothetical protein